MFAKVQRAKAKPGRIDQAVFALREAAMGLSPPQQTILLVNRQPHNEVILVQIWETEEARKASYHWEGASASPALIGPPLAGDYEVVLYETDK
jgi:hypothetical protein